MSNTVIHVDNLGKLYRLGEIGTGTLSHDLNRLWARLRGKQDPFSRVGRVNDRTAAAEKNEHIWALNDINFTVKQGEVLGIIGKNGAGKSTLLKLLSRVTSPSQGAVKIKGRVASLLEVGTGFHPEMTGRENVYMNGTIMGMRRHEISAKLDDIVDFAGVAKYLDTPVKRYSSGMTVRLGFAIAAFLEPEILIVDEVLAVGDAEFQKRAIGKMQDVSQGQGRTVLFVSHNMASVQRICNRLLLLKSGHLNFDGEVNDGIDFYLNSSNSKKFDTHVKFSHRPEDDYIQHVKFLSKPDLAQYYNEEDIEIEICFYLKNKRTDIDLNMSVFHNDNKLLTFHASDMVGRGFGEHEPFLKGENSLILKIPKFVLNAGIYTLNLGLHYGYKEFVDIKKDQIKFEILNHHKKFHKYPQAKPGVINLNQ